MNNLENLSNQLSIEQKIKVIDILKCADIAWRIKRTSFQKELKVARKRMRGGKIKRVLAEIANHPNLMNGVNHLFEIGGFN